MREAPARQCQGPFLGPRRLRGGRQKRSRRSPPLRITTSTQITMVYTARVVSVELSPQESSRMAATSKIGSAEYKCARARDPPGHTMSLGSCLHSWLGDPWVPQNTMLLRPSALKKSVAPRLADGFLNSARRHRQIRRGVHEPEALASLNHLMVPQPRPLVFAQRQSPGLT